MRLTWRTRQVTPTPRSLRCSRRAGASSAQLASSTRSASRRCARRSTRWANETPSSAASLLATLAAELLFGDALAERKRLIHEAVAMARRVGDDTVLVRALNMLTAMQADVFDLDGMLALGREALEVAERIDDPALATMAASGLHVLACRAGHRVEADAALAPADRAHRAGPPASARLRPRERTRVSCDRRGSPRRGRAARRRHGEDRVRVGPARHAGLDGRARRPSLGGRAQV